MDFNNTKLAVFDVCGTIYSCNTTFEFVHFVKQKQFKETDKEFSKNISKKHKQTNFWGDAFLIKSIDFCFPKLKLRNKVYVHFLKLFSKNELEKFSKEFVETFLKKKAIPQTMQIMHFLKLQDYEIALISCAPDFLIKSIANHLSIPHYIGAKYENGAIENIAGKKQDFLKLLPKYSLLYCISDNKSDLLLLNLATHRNIVINKNNYSFFAKRFNSQHFVYL